MAQTKEGAQKVAAAKAGVSAAKYKALLKSGKLWCTRCKSFHSETEFGDDRTLEHRRFKASSCLRSRRAHFARTYIHKGPPAHSGPPPYPPRSGDKKQARQRINVLVRTGKLAKPNTLPCFDCGHQHKRGERRHEYDHYKGYAAKHHYDVQAVCTKCHRQRAIDRGELIQQRGKTGRFESK